jgi:hypothetical protein
MVHDCAWWCVVVPVWCVRLQAQSVDRVCLCPHWSRDLLRAPIEQGATVCCESLEQHKMQLGWKDHWH